MIPPGQATTPVPITVLPGLETIRRTVERRTFDSMPARCRRSTTTATVPGSVVGTMVGTGGAPGSGDTVTVMVTPVATNDGQEAEDGATEQPAAGDTRIGTSDHSLDRPVRRLGRVAPEPVVGSDHHRIGSSSSPQSSSERPPMPPWSSPCTDRRLPRARPRGASPLPCAPRRAPHGPTPGPCPVWPYDDGVARDLAIDLGTANTLVYAARGASS